MTETAAHPLIANPAQYALGESREEIYLESSAHNRLAVQLLMDQTRHRFYVLSRDLDPEVFGTAELAESLSRLCRRSRHTDVRVLIADNRKLIQRTHRLLPVIRQFSSYVQVRQLPRRLAHLEQNYILADDGGVLLRPHGDAYNAKLCFHNPNQHKELREDFVHLWEHSDPDPNIRQLSY